MKNGKGSRNRSHPAKYRIGYDSIFGLKLSDVRYHTLNDAGSGLTEEEAAEGWHWCQEFDGMLVGPGMSEMECCTCAR